MFEGIFIAGILTAISIVIIALKFNRKWLRRFLGYDILFDLLITIGFMVFLAGTFAGALVAIISGMFVSIMFIVIKRFIGYERLSFKDKKLNWKRIK